MDVVDSFEGALLSIRNEVPDLVLLDIRLNGTGTGIDIAKEINDRWKIPFLFMSSNYDTGTMKEALDAFPHAILTKPCKDEDLLASIRLALSKEENQSISKGESINDESFFVKSEHAYQRIEIADLLYIKGEGSYTTLRLVDDRIVLRATLKDFEFLGNREDIMRVHRSYFVNLKFIDKIHSKHLEIKEFEIPMSKEAKEEILSRIQKVR